MKTICCHCDDYMKYEDHEPMETGSVGIEFKCTQCGYRIRLITNAGETMLVTAMGIKIGSMAGGQHEPLELTRSLLVDENEATTTESIKWSVGALGRIDRIPPFVRPIAKQSIEEYALEKGCGEITEQVLDEYKEVRGHM